MNKQAYYKGIVDYYDRCEVSYKDVWDLDNSLAMHYGYWNFNTSTLSDSLRMMNVILSIKANITKNDKVLDAGCGVGGSSIYLAKNIGCNVTGISISEKQIASATKNSIDVETTKHTNFIVSDYLNTPFENDTFDVVWAIESVCYAEKKELFLKEAFRLLKKGGRLIIADGMMSKTNLTEKENNIIQTWFNGWAMCEIDQHTDFKNKMMNIGFSQCEMQDITEHILKSSRKLYFFGIAALVITFLNKLIGKKYGNASTIANARGAKNQYLAIKKGLWKYYISSGVKI